MKILKRSLYYKNECLMKQSKVEIQSKIEKSVYIYEKSIVNFRENYNHMSNKLIGEKVDDKYTIILNEGSIYSLKPKLYISIDEEKDSTKINFEYKTNKFYARMIKTLKIVLFIIFILTVSELIFDEKMISLFDLVTILSGFVVVYAYEYGFSCEVEKIDKHIKEIIKEDFYK